MKSSIKIGDIVLVKFPFSNQEGTKKRPALVLSLAEVTDRVSLVTIAMITSKVEGLKFPGDCKIEHWQEVGLLYPSLVRFAKVATIEKELATQVLGRMKTSDLKNAQVAFRRHFKPWC